MLQNSESPDLAFAHLPVYISFTVSFSFHEHVLQILGEHLISF